MTDQILSNVVTMVDLRRYCNTVVNLEEVVEVIMNVSCTMYCNRVVQNYPLQTVTVRQYEFEQTMMIDYELLSKVSPNSVQ
jgi:hypothetical protein